MGVGEGDTRALTVDSGRSEATVGLAAIADRYVWKLGSSAVSSCCASGVCVLRCSSRARTASNTSPALALDAVSSSIITCSDRTMRVRAGKGKGGGIAHSFQCADAGFRVPTDAGTKAIAAYLQYVDGGIRAAFQPPMELRLRSHVLIVVVGGRCVAVGAHRCAHEPLYHATAHGQR